MHQSNNYPPTLSAGLKRLSNREYKLLHLESIELIKLNVKNPIPYFLLGALAFDHKNFLKAKELFRQATAYNSSSAIFKAYLAKTFSTLNLQNDARNTALEATKLSIEDAHVADMIGVVLSRTGNHADAEPMFSQAVSLDPKQANYHYNHASSLQFIGEFELAKDAYLKAIERDNNSYRAWSSLTSLRKQTESDNHLIELKQLFQECEKNEDAQLHYGHAIAKTLEDLGRFEESLIWLKRSKKAKRASIGYNVDSDLHNFEAARETLLSPPYLRKNVNNSDASPIFIVGLPRTGTTLVDRILSSHSQVVSAGELNTFAGLIKKHAETKSNLVLDRETLQRAKVLDLSNIGEQYLSETEMLKRGLPRMTDKMPLNFFYVGLIHQALPNARIIALRRNAMDSCLSNYRQLFSTSYSYYNYTFDLEDTALYYRKFDQLIGHWRNVLPSNRFLEVNYEDIVFHQEQQTRQLLTFCGLEWEESTLRFHENTSPVSTASSVQVRQPLYSGSIGRWKKYGTALDGLQSNLATLSK